MTWLDFVVWYYERNDVMIVGSTLTILDARSRFHASNDDQEEMGRNGYRTRVVIKIFSLPVENRLKKVHKMDVLKFGKNIESQVKMFEAHV